MTGIKKICALVLALMIVVTAGIVSVSAAQESSDTSVAAEQTETETGITIHVRDDEVAQPYIYLWNSLPTNSAMSESYPGEKLTKSGDWFIIRLTM